VEQVCIAENVARVRERLARAAERSGRRGEGIRLVAVAKQIAAAQVKEAIAAGVGEVGENYVQEAAAKQLVLRSEVGSPLRRVAAEIGAEVRWHFIGHLQTNKAGQAARIFDMIHTVDSVRLAQALARRAQQLGRTLEVLAQVNTSGEGSKFGVAPEEAESLVASIATMTGVQVQGLMTIGLWHPDPERGRPEFRLLADLAKRVQDRTGVEMQWLSMGMSHDFEVAIEEGANLVRVGTAIFGARPAGRGQVL